MRLLKFIVLVFFPFFLFACSIGQIYKSRGVENLTIDESGRSGRSDSIEKCKNFKPTEQQIKRFFSRAVPVERHFVVDDWHSPCYADGTISFAGGGAGKWRLYSSGTAILFWSFGEDVVYLYNGRNNGWSDPFECGYGYSDDEEECIIPGF